LTVQQLDEFLQLHQPQELRALRLHALTWMERLCAFRPHLTHDVWHGTADRDSDIWLSLFCDDSKSAELALINNGLQFDVGQTRGFHRQTVDVLSLQSACPGLGPKATPLTIGIHLVIYDFDDLRGALSRGQRGNIKMVQKILDLAH
jgi:hypothetical protein